MKKRIECFVSGRVQGVLYRNFTRRKAHKLGLFGEVKNLTDGRVRVIAEGEEGVLKKFVELLKEGSMFSHVQNVEVAWLPPNGEFRDFRIVF